MAKPGSVNKMLNGVVESLSNKLSAGFLSAEGLANNIKTRIHTGSTLLDLAIGGGIASGRVTNVIGDSSSGKTDLALEASAYVQNVLKGVVVYCDCEHTLESNRAEVYGVDANKIVVVHSDTVEEWYKSVIDTIKIAQENPDTPILYVLDSLDSLSDEAEKGRDITEGTYAMNKAKMLSTVFRKVVGSLTESNVSLLIISQTRANIGAMFGNKWTVSGGKALSFYCSTRILLTEIGKVKQGANKRIVGINVKAKVIKSKLCSPFAEVVFPILFEIGIDNIGSIIEWIRENTDLLGNKKGYFYYEDKSYRLLSLISYIENNNLENVFIEMVKKHWLIVNPEKVFNRKKKYGK